MFSPSTLRNLSDRFGRDVVMSKDVCGLSYLPVRGTSERVACATTSGSPLNKSGIFVERGIFLLFFLFVN